MKLKGLLAAVLTVSSPCFADEVPACNNQDVLNTLQSGTLEKERKWALDFIANQPAGPNTPAIRADIEHWRQDIVSIRQQKYDEIDNIRYCWADVTKFNANINVALVLLASGMPDTSCGHSVNYKIERTLDRPDDFYVSWKCH